jgi:hypothetical protein
MRIITFCKLAAILPVDERRSSKIRGNEVGIPPARPEVSRKD